jgi:hypothetical protein
MARSTAIHHRHGGALAHHADVRVLVDAASTDALDVLRQADGAVAVRALQIGLGHQRGHLSGIGLGQALAQEGRLDEGFQGLELNDGGRHGERAGRAGSGCRQVSSRGAEVQCWISPLPYHFGIASG